MLCSVAMSTYNGAKFLREQLDSIFSQTHPVDEIVVSDDASTDDTLNILDHYRRAHPEVAWNILPAQQNQGFRLSFRRALAHCTGELIFLCDQDDRWAHNKVERIVSVFSQNPQVLSLVTDFRTIDAEGKPLNPPSSGENLWVSSRVLRQRDPLVQITLREMLGRNQGQGCTMALRKSVAQEYIALDKAWTHDWILNLIAAMHGGLYFLKEPLIDYRLHGSNVIGMAQGEHAQRHVSPARALYELALAGKYTLLEGDVAACRNSLLSVTMDKYEFVFSHIPCAAPQAQELAQWKALTTKRLKLIQERRLFRYLVFFLRHPRYFHELAYFSTNEQFVQRLMMDLCAIIKE